MKSLDIIKIGVSAESVLALGACGNKTTMTEYDGFVLVEQPGAPTLGYAPESRVKLIEQDCENSQCQ